MTSKALIRFADPKDIDQLINLCEAHAQYEEVEYSRQGKRQALKTHLFSPNPPLHCLVVELGHTLIGYATYMKQYSTWDGGYYIYMDCLFLSDKSRGHGIGEKLINKIKEESSKMGIDQVQWQTPEFNEGAIRFYKRIGATAKTKERFFLHSSTEKA